jgi:flagella basal body P-ring formation protein FlgA
MRLRLTILALFTPLFALAESVSCSDRPGAADRAPAIAAFLSATTLPPLAMPSGPDSGPWLEGNSIDNCVHVLPSTRNGKSAAALDRAVLRAELQSAMETLGMRPSGLEILSAVPDPLPMGSLRLSRPTFRPEGGTGGECHFQSYGTLQDAPRHSITIRLEGRFRVSETDAFAARDLSAGSKLAAKDIELRPRPGCPSAVSNLPSDVSGFVLRRPARKGDPIRPVDLSPPLTIERGGPLQIVFHSDRLTVAVSGTAASDGRLNQLIFARNASSGKLVRVRLTAPGMGTAVSDEAFR